MRLTEDDVIKGNSALIKSICKSYCKGIEFADCEAEVLLGLLLAIRSYQRGVCNFKSHAKVYIKNHIKEAKREYYRSTRCESRLSMDSKVNNCRECIGSIFASGSGDLEEIISFNDFVKHLDKKIQQLIRFYQNGYSEVEILEKMHISKEYLTIMKSQLLKELKQYNAG